MTTTESPMLQVLREDGTAVTALPAGLTPERLREALRWMKIARVFDGRAIALQRQGRSLTYAGMYGQEAALVGSALALDPARDWIVPQYRESIALAIHGFGLDRFFLYLRGHPAGGAVPDGVKILPVQISVGTQITHAVGIAWGLKLQETGGAAIGYFGDGATSEGAFHEGANFAGVMGAPVVLFCQNNGWAISTPRSRQTAARTIAEKASGYGFPGIQVDGNDLVAIYSATREAVERARSGDGPTLIEAVTYRLGAHTTADDPSRYVPTEELERQKQRDPIARLSAYLKREGLVDEEDEAALDEEARVHVADAYARAEAEPDPPDDGFFNHIYAAPPARLEEQRAAYRALRNQ
ncbi:MAG: pyruvate dehydrogenase (acetyl-transferring) E1 component subunit alpha [Dehalococcoidia bacterium]